MAQTVTGTLTNLNDVVEIPTGDQSSVGIRLDSVSPGEVVFEQCLNPGDGATWSSLFVLENGTGGQTALTTAAGLFRASCNGTAKIRVRLQTADQPVAVEMTATAGDITFDAYSGSILFDIRSQSQGTNNRLDNIQTISSNNYITAIGGQTALGQNIVRVSPGTNSLDVSNYRSVYLQIVPTGTVSSGAVTFEGSNDNANFVAVALYDEASLTANPVTSYTPATGVTRYFAGPLNWRYFRARISTAIGGGGSLQAFTNLSPVAFSPDALTVTQATAVNLQCTATLAGTNLAIVGQTAEDAAATGNPVRVGGLVRTALPAFTNVAGDAINLTISNAGQAIVKPFAPAELDFVANATVTTNSQTAIRAAQGANVRQCITSIVYQNTNATATTLTIQDGSTTLITFSCPASMANPVQLRFATPLRGSANAALNYTAGTTGANVLLNVTGFNAY